MDASSQPEPTSPPATAVQRPFQAATSWGVIVGFAAINLLASSLSRSPQYLEPARYRNMVHVVATPTTRGTAPTEAGRTDFWIDRHEVTNAEFRAFLVQSGHKPMGGFDVYASAGREQHPVVGVTWDDAAAYARWHRKRLPTAVEWEHALGDDRLFPWGDTYEAGAANINSKGALPVGSCLRDTSPTGVQDLAGNVLEWTASTVSDPSLRPGSPPCYLVKGCCWALTDTYARRTWQAPHASTDASFCIGFRCVLP